MRSVKVERKARGNPRTNVARGTARAARVAQAICGVIRQFFARSSG